jgi:hypothetical protein
VPTMPKIIVEPSENGGYDAIQNRKVITHGRTQELAGDRAHRIDPSATVEAARVRWTPGGKPDKFRVLHHGVK